MSDDTQSVAAAPFVGRWTAPRDIALVLVVLLGLALLRWMPVVFDRVSDRWLPTVAGALSVVWATGLASAGGISRLSTPLENRRHEYEPLAATIGSGLGDLRGFVDTYVEQLPTYPTHVRGHPPGMTMVFWFLDRLGLGSPAWGAVIVIGAWGLGVAAVLVAFRAVAGSDPARAAAPFVAVAPAVIWAATSADAFFTGVTAVAVALMVVAAVRDGARAHLLVATGGGLFAFALHLTYGAAPLLLIPIGVIVWTRRWDLVPAGVGAAAVVTTAFVAGGFWWLDGLEATRAEYVRGIASQRSWLYFVWAGNPAAFALATGPAWVLGIRRARGVAISILPVAALAAVTLADLSGLSKAETERIWLPFVPWVVLAAAAVPANRRRRYLAPTLLIAVVLQAGLVSPW